jgi:hypothetical protein
VENELMTVIDENSVEWMSFWSTQTFLGDFWL